MRSRGIVAFAAGLAAAACSKGGTPITGPTAPPVPTYSVTATVFYDENGNGLLDPSEATRVPGVVVAIGTGTGTSAPGSGQAVVTGIQEGSLTAAVHADSLPAYFQAPSPLPIQVPATSTIQIPLTLPIGNNNANVYWGYGDSITAGDGSSDGQGYRLKLQSLLGPYFARADVQTTGRSGTFSSQGPERIRVWIAHYNPAYMLLLYGTNDWNDESCQNADPLTCYTIDSLRQMIEVAKDRDTLPVVATIIPGNPALVPPGRNTWYDQMNVGIKAMAQNEQVLVADLNAEFKAASNPASLYSDQVHPNDAGYQVMAQGWFKAITRARSAAASSSRRFGFSFHP
ncbi:MAG TPA: GDSL-type esterase/lipase family protein [Vicinamibacteria bacterium]|nr:GDSL-type esterase/lipase family protein [Vicinamibacteria bacterium]